MFSKMMSRAVGAVSVLGVGFALFSPESAQAATATANINVTATVSANCAISSTGVAFGTYDPVSANASTPLDQTGTVTVTCTSGTAAVVSLDQGLNAPNRQMASGANRLTYQLYSDAGRTVVWNTANTVAHVGTGAATALTVFGRIPSAQNVAAGAYSDTVTATITY